MKLSCLYIILLLAIGLFIMIKYDNKLYEKFSNGDEDNILSVDNLENLKSFLREYKKEMIKTGAYTIEEYNGLTRIVGAASEGEPLTQPQETHIRELINFMKFTTSAEGRKTINKLSVKEIVSLISKNSVTSKKEIYNYCIELKNEN